MLALVAIAAGCAAGLASGGSLRGLGNIGVRFVWLPMLGVVALAVLNFGPRQDAPVPMRIALVGASYACVGAFVWMNRARPGVWLIAVGMTMNVAVILANGGMPVSAAAARAAGIGDPSAQPDLLWGKHVVASSRTVLRPLSDVIPLRAGPLRQVASVGDFVILAGIAWVVAGAVRRSGRDAPG